ncbi:M23 family metallopeptidase [Litchfieldia salsa]|uniref:Murein DD-endopeptidase MepM and murein hydrolase activator NlpD, contain LysM domain n=1 Tax=Litchfieldia salsa TaxID=930152 RepID=A0A1H0UDS9_9BACI|nr:M23 family metallopeptidase [Litchfieldia salsa]SDP64339.1 Murein DD-endopeptidase MepM and murein hydrolase activator NlpD, contain LysM domain [Litchfieldia salsa]
MVKSTNNHSNYIKPVISKGLIKKIAISTLAFTSILIGSAVAENKISTDYHVYINGERMGTVDNEKVINEVIEEKISTLEETYKDKNYEFIADDILFIPEHVFHSNVNNEKTAENVQSNLKIVAKAAAIVVNDQPVAHLKSEEDANQALKQYKLNYVSEAELNELEAREKVDSELPKLEVGHSRILDVEVAEKVSLLNENIDPTKILSIEDTVNLLKKGTLEEKKYKVQSGDVLGSIAMDHELTTRELLDLNPGITEDTILQIGQEINVTAYRSLLTVNVSTEQAEAVKIEYEIEVIEDSSMFKGDQKVKQEGREGAKVVSSIVSKSNGATIEKKITSETITTEPVKKIVLKGTKVIPSRGTGQLAWPAVGGYISSHVGYRWGQMHKGIDIARPSDRTIKAADNGTVVSAGYDGGYGNKIVINHNNGMQTVYAHLDSISVSVGQTVQQGQKIGVMGATGHSTGVHLHFEVYQNGSLKNPIDYLN